jgi:hypothetical protein
MSQAVGTGPVEVSSGEIYRLSLRGNRRLNHVIHMAAINQIRHKRSDDRAYYERKIAEGKTHKEPLRCLKWRISDVIYARLRAGARAAERANRLRAGVGTCWSDQPRCPREPGTSRDTDCPRTLAGAF